ncbi:MAG: secretin N-terminal domain-containing protein [Nitrospiraceae bacterium]
MTFAAKYSPASGSLSRTQHQSRVARIAAAGLLCLGVTATSFGPWSATSAAAQPSAPAPSGARSAQPAQVTLDFNDVDLQVVVRFISELTGKNFVIDDTSKKNAGKMTIFSPSKVTVDQAYHMFLAALEVNRLMAIPKGNVVEIVAAAEAPPERAVFVYKLKHANATDVAALLTNLVARASATPVSTTPGGRPPVRPLTEFEAPVQVFADKATNSIVISSTKPAYTMLEAVMRGLDTKRNQVFVEAVILEVGVDRLRQIGSEPVQLLGAAKSGNVQGLGGFNRSPEDIASIAQLLSGAGTGGAITILDNLNVRAFLQFIMTMSDTNILSTPQVLASDNQKAKIVVGENRPFPTGQAQGITGGTLVTIERKDVGVTLEMTPQVLDDGHIRLEMKQEITAIAENVAQTIGAGAATVPVGPTTTKRAMETIAVAKDGQTLVVGGLVRDNITMNERKIPFLGDIPILGWLFRFQSKQAEKLNLLVFLTPHLIKNEADMQELNERKGRESGMVQRNNRIDEPTGLQRQVLEQLMQQKAPRESQGSSQLDGSQMPAVPSRE